MSASNSLSRILVVDDDAAWRTLMGLMLAVEGYQVSQASNGEQAIALYRRRHFDLVITELNLEGKDGFQILVELRREPVRVSFIAMVRSGWMPADFCLRMALQLGATHVLAKPFPPEHLLSAVRNVLN